MHNNRSVLAVLLALGVSPSLQAVTSAPLQLARVADLQQLDVRSAQYRYAEKLDGVRGYWDGQQLTSRHGTPIMAPAWFLQALPAFAVEGELWLGRGQFARLSGIVRQHLPNDADWRQVRFCLFDLPNLPAPFLQRSARLQGWVASQPHNFIQAIPTYPVHSVDQLRAKLRELEQAGGEGLMLYRADAFYQPGRSHALLKLKSHQDAEAQVVGVIPGKGKYQGMMGALLVEMPNGQRFRIGSGFSDEERREPPALGRLITYRFNGWTRSGKPRFARFMRVRPAE